MWRRALSLLSLRQFSSTPEIPTLYSFLQPSIFALKRTPPSSQELPKILNSTPKALTLDHKTALESNLQTSLDIQNTDEAWKSFKILTSNSNFPSKHLSNSLITHLSSLKDIHNLKRAFASVVFLLEKAPQVLTFETIGTLLNAMKNANTAAPAFTLIKSMFKNRFFPPFSLWGSVLIEISRKNGSFVAFLRLFNENCRISVDEKLDFMKPDLAACNAALEGCCYDLGSVDDVENVLETMSVLGVRPDESSFRFLAYLYALKGLQHKISELEILMDGFGFSSKRVFYSSLISGYVKSGNSDSVTEIILRSLREGDGKSLNFSEETYSEVVKGFLSNGSIKNLAKLIIKAQELESSSIGIEESVGFGIVNACVSLGLLDKAHSILDGMNAEGGSVGVGVYASILRAYCKEHRTTEAALLVTEITSSGLQLDAGSYDALIEASMANQDFQSAFSLFRDMREVGIPDLQASYLTIMTGLTENHRPELMAAFLDEVVQDPRVKMGTHDWNSIIHAFCKIGRLEDARRTFRRMVFLRFEPNDQTYLSLINGYVSAEKYFSVLLLWTEVRKRVSINEGSGLKFNHNLVDAFLYALVKGGFFDAVMQVVEMAQEMRIFVDKWRYKQAFMETHKKLKVAKLRKRNYRKMEALSLNGARKDFLELALQFGMIMMFACAFPLAFSFAALNNITEIRTDALKLLVMLRRPIPRDAATIGAWLNIFRVEKTRFRIANKTIPLLFLNYAATLIISDCDVNMHRVLLVCLYDQEGKWKIEPGLAAILVMEHVLLMIKFGFSHFVPEEPAWVKANRVKNAAQAQNVCSKQLLRSISGDKKME
ncbi:Pentatricopeptide repeat [Macleaya cordata]|uniref:Pentatricopeptide repeat n=1 Tax=Macleaya cordata TaxID=56857 RepID=A0A200QMN9_MACCD|nr:Pentatricopeptide repeat [Macleaya cordata]